MSKTKKNLISLLACVVFLGGLAFSYTIVSKKPQDVTQTPTPTPQSTFFNLIEKDKAELIALSVTKGNEKLSLVLKEDKWVQEGNETQNLDQTLVSELVDNFCNTYSTDKVDIPSNDLGTVGLSPAQMVVRGTFKDQQQETLSFGIATLTDQHYYTMLQNDPAVYLVDKYKADAYNKTFGELLDRTIPTMAVNDLFYLKIARKGKPTIEAKANDLIPEKKSTYSEYGNSQLVSILPLPDQMLYMDYVDERVLAFASKITLGEWVAPESDDLSIYGFDTPTLNLVLEGSTSVYDLTVGKNTDDSLSHFFAKIGGNPNVFKITNQSLKELLSVDEFALIQRFIALEDITNVNTVSLTIGGTNYNIKINNSVIKSQKEGQPDENVIAPIVNGQDIQEGAFKTFYQVLIGISYDAYIEAQQPIGKPLISIVYSYVDNRPTKTLEFYDYNENFYCVAVDGKPANFLISKQYMSVLQNYMLDLLAGKLNRD